MSDRRSAFRFRVPPLRPPVPPPRTTTATSQTQARRPPFQPQPQPSPSVRPPAPLDPPVIPSPVTAPPPILQPPAEPSTVPETHDELALPPPAEPSPVPEKHDEPALLPPTEPSTVPEKQDEPTSVSPSRLSSKPVEKVPSLPSSPVKTISEEALPVPETPLSNSQTDIEDTPQVKVFSATNHATDSNFTEEKHEDISTTSNVPDTPQNKSAISDTVRVSESPQSLKPMTGPHDEETMGQQPISVITFSGDNKGTCMRIGSGVNKREMPIHIYRRYMANPDETSEAEESSEEKKPVDDLNTINSQGENAYVNCNIQGINNSMVFNCSITESNPGVHLGSSFIKKNRKNRKTKSTNSMDTENVKTKITSSQNYTYEPTIGRRCLGGLFMESSDSDADDPEKPRRHGCRYIGVEKINKDDKMDNR